MSRVEAVPFATLVRAANASPMTLDGTNTWVLSRPGSGAAVVVDPGPADPAHLATVRRAARDLGARVELVVLTHGHRDHAEGATAFAELAGAPIRAGDPALCRGAQPLADREQLHVGGLAVEVLATPGHTADSMCLVAEQDTPAGPAVLLTGDTVLGRGSSVVARPDGRLADYLHTLARLRQLADERELLAVLPGHGPVRADPAALLGDYLDHRGRRLDQVRAAIAGGASTAEEVLDRVYGEVAPALRAPALWSLGAQLDYLRDAGEPVPPG